MLSNPAASFQAAHGQHRRQQSTPMAFISGAKAPVSASAQQSPIDPSRFAAGHRRGVSLDVRRRQQTHMQALQDFRFGMHSNSAMAATSQHHVMREAQQQGMHARPEAHHPLYETYLISPHDANHAQHFDPSSFNQGPMSFGSYENQMNIVIPKHQGNYMSNDLFASDSTQSTPTFLNFPESPMGAGWVSEGEMPGSRKLTKRISNGILSRVAKYESLGMDELQPPATPTSLNGSDYLPPTPLGTPHDRVTKPDQRPSRFHDDYDESMVETIKPTRKRQTQAAQNIFDDIRQQTDQCITSTGAPDPSTVVEHHGYGQVQMQMPDYMNMNVIKDEFERIGSRYDGLPAADDMIPIPSDHAHQHMALPANSVQMEPPMGSFDEHRGAHDLHSDASSQADSPSRIPRHRRTESMASIASAASIANINIEETRTETGVTLEEIAQYIQSPDTTDGKWTCLFEGCGKQFGRKENIKSHVQTHLNDRQYQCPTCQKCFVRQHDLKRHAKIHTGIKPYPCACGNSFARHDALTRHRQRGMCIGAFDGIVRKVVKRGRPKKNRPDMDTRVEKSAKTRRKNASISSISSQSGYSDCSSVIDSEDNDEEMFEDMLDMGMDARSHQEMSSMSSAPMPAAAPRAANDFVPSPAVSAQSFDASDAVADRVSRPGSPQKISGSQNNTPPDLSQSSSPPARFFDLDHSNPTLAGTDNVSNMNAAPTTTTATTTTTPSTTPSTAAHHMMATANLNGTIPISSIAEQDDDMLIQFTGEDGLVQLERDPIMMMTKFDEEFDSTVSMFATNDDVFFA